MPTETQPRVGQKMVMDCARGIQHLLGTSGRTFIEYFEYEGRDSEHGVSDVAEKFGYPAEKSDLVLRALEWGEENQIFVIERSPIDDSEEGARRNKTRVTVYLR